MASYTIKTAGDLGVDLITKMGSGYECKDYTVYNGSDCVKIARMAVTPPCYLGWEQRGNECYWKGK